MSGRTVIVIALALVCGLSAAVGIQIVMRKPAAAVKTEPVLFAAADIQRGETIDEKMIEVRKVPVGQTPPGALAKLEDVVGRAAHYPMLKGDALADAKLTAKGSGGGMAGLIRPGMRAFTIQTPTLSSSLAGFLLPGNKVDVLLTISNTNDSTGGAATTTLLQNVEILAVHTNVDSPAANKIDPNEARSVTLLVSPDDASLLDLGQNKGTLHLTLRNPKDTGSEPRKEATVADLHLPGAPAKQTPAEEAPAAVAKPEDPDFSSKIDPGMRAFSIETQSFTSSIYDKILKRGCHVDVLHTNRPQLGRSATSVLIQNVVILDVQELGSNPGQGSPAAGAVGGANGAKSRLVTLLVTLDECLKLDHGQKTGTFSLCLRHFRDESRSGLRQASLSGHHLQVTPPMVTTAIRTLRGTRGGADRVTFPSLSTPADAVRPGVAEAALTLNPSTE